MDGQTGRGEVPGHHHELACDGQVFHGRDGEVGDPIPVQVDQHAQAVRAGHDRRGVARGRSGRIDQQCVDTRAADHRGHARGNGKGPAALRQQQRIRQVQGLVVEEQVLDVDQRIDVAGAAGPDVPHRCAAQAIGRDLEG